MVVGSAYESQEQAGTAQEDGLRVSQFRGFLEDCRWQPSWRNMADKCADYYDGNQLDQDTLDALDRKGMGPLIRNITAPLVNVVLGMEAKTRTDWRVSADSDNVQDVAEALSAKLHEAERESRADRACSDGYAGQIKAGLGWVEVSRNADPFQYPYRAEGLHRREIWWDWRDQSAALDKARYLIRKRWFDVDQAISYFPEHQDLLRSTVGDSYRYDLITSKRALDLGMSLEEVRGLDIEDMEEWRSFDRQRLCLYEVWYRNFVRGWVSKLPNGSVIELEPKNPVHLALLNRGAIKPERAVYAKLRQSIWAGPHKLVDCASKKRHLPYVPFWGYREDRTGVPYGLIRAMLSPQDEVNARLQKMMWLLGAKRVEMDSDALDLKMQSPQDMLAELARPDATVILNPQRQNKQGAFNVNDNLTLADAQFKVLQDAMMSAQQVVGIYNATLGRDSSTTANSAIQSLVDQSTTALAEINDNYRYARRLVGERLLDHVRDDLIGVEVEVMAGEQGRKRKIVLNQRAQQPQQQLPNPNVDPEAAEQAAAVEHMKNDVASSKVRVALDDVPSSPAYREQQFTMLAELTKGLPPQLQALVVPWIMEASDLQKRREIADTLRKAMGVPTPKTPEEERQAEQAQAQAMQFTQEIQKKQALLELQEREAKVDELRAKAEKMRAEIGGNPELAGAKAEADKRIGEIEAQCRADIDRVTAELMTVRINAGNREQKLIGDLARVTSQLAADAGNRTAEIERAKIEKEIAEIEKSKEIEVARIQADGEKAMQAMSEQMVKMRDGLTAQIEKVGKDAERSAESAAKDTEKRLRDEQRVADKARGDAERKSKAESDAKDKAKPAKETAAAPINLALQVTVESGGESEVTITPNKDGSMTATKKPKKAKPK